MNSGRTVHGHSETAVLSALCIKNAAILLGEKMFLRGREDFKEELKHGEN
jgi:hypothetical protein